MHGSSVYIGWATSIRTRLLAAFAVASIATVIACGIGVVLFAQVATLFDSTVAVDVRRFGGDIGLRSAATQLGIAATSFGGADNRQDLAAAEAIVAQQRARLEDEEAELRRTGLGAELKDVDAAFQALFDGFAKLKVATEARLAAQERRVALSNQVLPITTTLNNLINPKFFGDSLNLSISIQGDDVPADQIRAKRDEWAKAVQRLQDMLQFRVAASTASAILADLSTENDLAALARSENRFTAAARSLVRFEPAFGDQSSPVAAASNNLLQLAQGTPNLFTLRADEVRLITAETAQIKTIHDAAGRLSDELAKDVTGERSLMDRSADASRQRLDLARDVLLAIAVASVLANLLIAFLYVGRGIAGRLLTITEAMSRLARGDRATEVPATQDRDEIGEMSRALQVFKDRAIAANALAERVIDDVRQVAIAAGQASAAISQVANGSNVQLEALRNSANALDQSAKAIADVAKSSQLASERVREAASLANGGIAEMAAMVETVVAIANNSSQISKIAVAIGHISSQTNMLSLNAAIEAAHAGEHGKGFAVVAEEVRKLAENSQALTQEIAEQVHQSTEQAERAVSRVRQVSSSMNEIGSGVAESDRLIGSIAAAMEEQQATVNDVNRNIGELSRIGQTNATAAEEISATMLELSKLA
ncbi:MAG: methyl-accepting chemotaxis protein, partial [Stellaceae bacterium]